MFDLGGFFNKFSSFHKARINSKVARRNKLSAMRAGHRAALARKVQAVRNIHTAHVVASTRRRTKGAELLSTLAHYNGR
jgi:hypothetical protein